jgi:hypothetical protein
MMCAPVNLFLVERRDGHRVNRAHCIEVDLHNKAFTVSNLRERMRPRDLGILTTYRPRVLM